jgi:hypothetical protein
MMTGPQLESLAEAFDICINGDLKFIGNDLNNLRIRCPQKLSIRNSDAFVGCHAKNLANSVIHMNTVIAAENSYFFFNTHPASVLLTFHRIFHTSLSVDRRLGSNKGVPSTNNLVALSLMCSIVPRRSCDSSCRAGSRSPSGAATAFAQSSRIRSSILR